MSRMAAICVAILLSTFSNAADWSRFRGENGSGATAEVIPIKWNKETTRWSVELPGVGNGSPIAVKNKVYLQSANSNGTERYLVCIDALTGKKDWVTTLKGNAAHIHQKNSLASSTPACDGERVYCFFWDGKGVALHAFNLAGRELWKKELGGYKSQHGPGSSPMVVKGHVIVNYDQDELAEIVAFDGKTGKKGWSASRKAFRACYSTPFIRLRDGKEEVVVASTAGLTGYDPDSGAVTWNWDWKFDGMALRTVGSPMISDQLIVAISGDGNGARHTVVVDPESSGKGPEMKWEKKKDTPYVPGPVVNKDHLFWVTDAGIAMCVELKTGKEIWKERVFSKAVSASLIMTQSQSKEPLVLGISESGQAVFFKASPEGYERVSENELKDSVFATPAVSNNKLFIRTGSKLICIENKSIKS